MDFEFWRTKTDEFIDKYGNFIIDYPIYEGKKAGINTVIFVIEKKNYQILKDTISKRVEDKVETHYVFQSLDLISDVYSLPKDRIKLLGITQAILEVKNLVSDKFIIINAR